MWRRCPMRNTNQDEKVSLLLKRRSIKAPTHRTHHLDVSLTDYSISNKAAFLGDPNFPNIATNSTNGGRIRLYESLYKQYSRLQFSRDYDRPIAIAGLEQRLIRAFDTQGGYGVFERYFGRSLLWQRDSDVARMEKIDFPGEQQFRMPT